MAKVVVPYQPGLTADDAMEVFRRHFAGRYKASRYRVQRGRKFILRKSVLVGVTVGLRQGSDSTAFVFTGAVPFPGMLLILPICFLGLVPALILWLILRASWKPMEEEVRWFLQDSNQFPLLARNVQQGTLGYSPSGSLPCTSCGASLAGQARFCQVCGTPPPVPEPKRRPSCTACGAPLGEDSRFCQACGAPVPLPEPEAVDAGPDQVCCTQCGTQVPASSLYCHKCGAAIVREGAEEAPQQAAASPGSEEQPQEAGGGCP